MRKVTTYSHFLTLLLLGTLCNVPLHGSTPPFAGSAPRQQQTSGNIPSESAQQGPPTQEPLTLSDQVIQDVLEPLRTGMETQNAQQVLSVFDKRELSGYSNLQGQLRAFFRQYDEVRFRYQILQAAADKDHASAIAEIEMDALPYDVTAIPTRRSVQMRFQLKQEPKGWRVVGFSPSDFFSLEYSRGETR